MTTGTASIPSVSGPTAGRSVHRQDDAAGVPRPTARRRSAVLGFWALLLAVTALWAAHDGLTQLAGFLPLPGVTATAADAWVSLARITGLIASALLLVQVLLMARVPVLENGFGRDDLTRIHRLVGFTSFGLVLAHLALSSVGYAVSAGLGAPTGPFVEFLDLVVSWPGMLLALIGTLLLTTVALTSRKAARRRLRYESWHLLHLYAYLGVGLALPHQLWTGTDFAGEGLVGGLTRLLWWSVYGGVLVAVVGYRIVLPATLSRRHRIVVERVVPEAPGMVSVHLRGRNLESLRPRAGQFFVWRFLDGAGFLRGHPYSLSAAPRGDRLRITIKDLGDGSRRAARLRPGTRVLLEGPYGTLHGGVRTRRKVTLLGAGVGITPLRALLEALPYRPGDATLVYRVSEPQDVLFEAELQELVRLRGARVFVIPGHRTPDRASWLPVHAAHLDDRTALQRLVPDIAEHDVYVCGQEDWMAAVTDAAVAAGVPRDRIHTERFGW